MLFMCLYSEIQHTSSVYKYINMSLNISKKMLNWNFLLTGCEGVAIIRSAINYSVIDYIGLICTVASALNQQRP